MNRQQRASVGFLVVFLTVGIAREAAPQADSGWRVRVTTDEQPQRSWVGTLLSADVDSLRLTSSKGQQRVVVPTRAVLRFERSRERQSNAGRGALVGGLVGGGTGLLLGLLASAENDSWFEIGAEEVAAVTALFGATGAGLGALIGSASHRERWEPIPVPGRAISRTTWFKRVRLGLAMSF